MNGFMLTEDEYLDDLELSATNATEVRAFSLWAFLASMLGFQSHGYPAPAGKPRS